MGRFDDKKALITGGTIGMGLSMAEKLAAEGAEVLVTGRSEANLAAARERMGPDVQVVKSDTAKLEDITALREQVERELESLDAVFVNAGVAELGPIDVVTEQDYDVMFDVNAKGAYFTARSLAPLVRPGGAFVF